MPRRVMASEMSSIQPIVPRVHDPELTLLLPEDDVVEPEFSMSFRP